MIRGMAPRVVILGCGFGGLWAAQALRRAPVDVTVSADAAIHVISKIPIWVLLIAPPFREESFHHDDWKAQNTPRDNI